MNYTMRETAAALGFPDQRWVSWLEKRAIRKLWRNRNQLAKILEGKAPRPRDGKWAIDGGAAMHTNAGLNGSINGNGKPDKNAARIRKCDRVLAAAEKLPTFELRGDDVLAPQVLRYYGKLAQRLGLNQQIIDEAYILAARMEAWSPRKLPGERQ